MKAVITLLAGVLLAVPAMADDAPRGRRVGDGVNLPREVAANKTAAQRANEIWQWMLERDGKTSRSCYTKDKYCVDKVVISLTGGGSLQLSYFQNLDGRPNLHVYCRFNPAHDLQLCYRMQRDQYLVMMKDSISKEWGLTWDEGANSETTSSKPKPSDIEL